MQYLIKNIRITPEAVMKVAQLYSRAVEAKPKHAQVHSREVTAAPKKPIQETRDYLCFAVQEYVSNIECNSFDKYLKSYNPLEVEEFLKHVDEIVEDGYDDDERIRPDPQWVLRELKEHAKNSKEEVKQMINFLKSKGNKACLKSPVLRKCYDDNYGSGDY